MHPKLPYEILFSSNRLVCPVSVSSLFEQSTRIYQEASNHRGHQQNRIEKTTCLYTTPNHCSYVTRELGSVTDCMLILEYRMNCSLRRHVVLLELVEVDEIGALDPRDAEGLSPRPRTTVTLILTLTTLVWQWFRDQGPYISIGFRRSNE